MLDRHEPHQGLTDDSAQAASLKWFAKCGLATASSGKLPGTPASTRHANLLLVPPGGHHCGAMTALPPLTCACSQGCSTPTTSAGPRALAGRCCLPQEAGGSCNHVPGLRPQQPQGGWRLWGLQLHKQHLQPHRQHLQAKMQHSRLSSSACRRNCSTCRASNAAPAVE